MKNTIQYLNYISPSFQEKIKSFWLKLKNVFLRLPFHPQWKKYRRKIEITL